MVSLLALVFGVVDARAQFRIPVPQLSNDELLHGLDEYAFAPFGSQTERFLTKWKSDIRIGTVNGGGYTIGIADFVTTEAVIVSKLTHLKIKFTDTDSNFGMVFTNGSQDDFEKYKDVLARLAPNEAARSDWNKSLSLVGSELSCVGKILVTNKKEIVTYIFFVSTREQDQTMIKACVFRELMRSFGLIHFSIPFSAGPTFSQDFERLRNTAHGLLAFLYRDDIPAGFSRSEVVKMLAADTSR